MIESANRYRSEYVLLAVTMLLSVTGFWKIYVGAEANPTPYHHLHVATDFIWLVLLFYQLNQINAKQFRQHRTIGLAILFVGPLLVATTSLLSVNSALKGVVSGKGDFLIIQNVGVTLEMAFLIALGFVLRKRTALHGSLMASTAILMMGIALFFTMISFVPGFKVEGPETVSNFQKSAITGQAICVVVGLLFYLRDRKNGWPFLLAGAFFVLNEGIRSFLSSQNLILPLTEFVGALNQPLTFVVSFAVFLGILLSTGVARGKQQRARESGFSEVAAPADRAR